MRAWVRAEGEAAERDVANSGIAAMKLRIRFRVKTLIRRNASCDCGFGLPVYGGNSSRANAPRQDTNFPPPLRRTAAKKETRRTKDRPARRKEKLDDDYVSARG